VGITPVRLGHRVVYAMRVNEVLSFARYWRDRRFCRKRPKWSEGLTVQRVGDNCYEPLGDRRFRQHRGHHSRPDGREHERTMAHDLSGLNVLASRHFTYYGARAVKLPEHLAFAVPGRGHRVRFSDGERRALRAWLTRLPRGIHGDPRSFVEAGRSTGKCTQ